MKKPVPVGFQYLTLCEKRGSLKYPKQPYFNFYTSRVAVKLAGATDETIRKVMLTVLPEDAPVTDETYWGWWDDGPYHPGTISMVFQAPVLVEICFPYGTHVCEMKGEGRVVKLKVEEL